MLLIDCPWCGSRPEGEFTCLGEAGAPRPEPAGLTDGAWSDLVVNRQNARGAHVERWWHLRSCGRIILVERDTLTHALGPGREETP